MKTKKPFSSISYNTDEHLTHVLNKWLKSGDIVFWAYINHKGEGQSQHPKDHKHVYIEPNKPILTTDFTESTMEFDIDNPLLPLKCVNCVGSVWEHWVWYTLHNPSYLWAHGGQSRKYQYMKNDYVFSDSLEFDDRFETAIHNADILNDTIIVRSIGNGVSVGSLALDGLVGMNNAVKVKNYYDVVRQGLQERDFIENEYKLNNFKQCNIADNPFI